jgi:hypothetical protein
MALTGPRRTIVAPVKPGRRAISSLVRFVPAKRYGQPRVPGMTLGILVEVREPAGLIMVVAGRFRRRLRDEEWEKLEPWCQEDFGEERSPARIAMRWFLSDDAVVDGTPWRFSLARASAIEPSFPLRVEPPTQLIPSIAAKLACANSVPDLLGAVESVGLAEYIRACGKSAITDSGLGFIACFPDERVSVA